MNFGSIVHEVLEQMDFSYPDDYLNHLPDNIKEKLFKINAKVIQKGTENESGNGLGLLLCSEFIKKHQGEIWAESEFGKGSTFKFILPLEG